MTKTICFDLRCLQIGHESRGIGMHARSILENLNPEEDYRYIFYAYDKNNPIKSLGIDVPVKYKLVQTRTLKKSIDRPRDFYHLAKVIFHKFSRLRSAGRIDYFIQFDFMLGIPNLSNIKKTVLVAYDLIPLIFENDYIPTPKYAFLNTPGTLQKAKKTLRAVYYKGRYRFHYSNFNTADLLLSISNSTTESLIDTLGVPSSKITTIPLAPVSNTSEISRPRNMASDKPFFFYIGATDARKRVADLIAAFNTVRTTHDIELVLAGKEFAKRGKIPNRTILESLKLSPYSSSIHTLGYLTDAEKNWMYQHAKVFVYPTAYEGFGLPLIEAMQQGCPVISYENSSIPEVAGDAAIMVPTGNVIKLAKAMTKVLDSPQLQDRMVTKGREHSRQYTWKNYMKNFYLALEINN